MKTKKRQYLDLLLQQPAEWIKKSAASPNKYMTTIDIKLHYIALRRKKAL